MESEVIAIGQGRVHHAREHQVLHRFQYPTFFLFFDVAKQSDLVEILRKKFWNVLSFRGSDYLEGDRDRDGDDLDAQIRDFARRQLALEPDEVWLQTMPRIFGYVFNPVSFWIFRRSGQVEGVLSEVNNTFGERHFYWVYAGGLPLGQDWYRLNKEFHVSPFMSVEGTYDFRFRFTDFDSAIDIVHRGVDGEVRLSTWIQGALRPVQDVGLRTLLLQYGWMTALVILRIHWQAFQLWRKKATFFRKPVPRQPEITS